MDVFFIGVGEACDPNHGNTSIHVVTGNQVHILLDCGFSVPHNYFAFSDAPDQLDLVWISHFHGDHFFGLPLLLLRFWEMGRSKPLFIAGQKGIDEKVYAVMDMAFPGFMKKLCYEIGFTETEPGTVWKIAGLELQTVETLHSQRNLGVLISDGSARLYYSGDGRTTEEVFNTVKNCDFAIHEAFMMDNDFPFHGSVTGCLELLEKSGIRKLALVHLDRRFRKGMADEIAAIINSNPSVMLPIRGTRIIV